MEMFKPMTKREFRNAFIRMYRTLNAADSDVNTPTWTKPACAGRAGCQHLDAMLHAMLAEGVLTGDEHQEIYDVL
jgi:hypothetical protein